MKVDIQGAHHAADLFRRDPSVVNARKAAALLWPVLSTLYEARSDLRRGESTAEYLITVMRVNRRIADENFLLRAELERLKAGTP